MGKYTVLLFTVEGAVIAVKGTLSVNRLQL